MTSFNEWKLIPVSHEYFKFYNIVTCTMHRTGLTVFELRADNGQQTSGQFPGFITQWTWVTTITDHYNMFQQPVNSGVYQDYGGNFRSPNIFRDQTFDSTAL